MTQTQERPRLQLSPGDYIQAIYDTGQAPAADQRPSFDDLLNKHVKIVETMAYAQAPKVAIQGKIDADPTLAALLAHPHARGENEQTEEDKRFTVAGNGKRIFKLQSIEDIYALPPAKYLITQIVDEVSVSLLYGVSGTGKTFTALDLALHIAHGLPWHGRKVKQGIVMFLNGEGQRNLNKRLRAWYIEHPDLQPHSNFQVLNSAVDLLSNIQVLIDTIESLESKPALILADNFSTFFPTVNQKNQEEVAPALHLMNQVAQDYECHVMMIHHTTKEDDFNGSMAFRNHVDTMIELKKEDKADKHSPILFTCAKPRDDEPFNDIKTELKQVTIYTDEITLETITSCAIVESETPIKSEGLQGTAQDILDILGDQSLMRATWEKECVKTLGIAPATFERHRKKLERKNYIQKYKPDGQKVDHYRKTVAEPTPMQGYGGDSD